MQPGQLLCNGVEPLAGVPQRFEMRAVSNAADKSWCRPVQKPETSALCQWQPLPRTRILGYVNHPQVKVLSTSASTCRVWILCLSVPTIGLERRTYQLPLKWEVIPSSSSILPQERCMMFQSLQPSNVK